MAQYKGREVEILKDLPHPQGDQVLVRHKELSLGQEIVMKKDVTVSEQEKKAFEKSLEDRSNDFKIDVEITKDTNTASVVKKEKK